MAMSKPPAPAPSSAPPAKTSGARVCGCGDVMFLPWEEDKCERCMPLDALPDEREAYRMMHEALRSLAAPASPPGGAADPASESPSTAGCATCGVKGFPHYDRLPTGTWVCAPCHDALGSGSCSPVPTPEQRASPAPGETPAARVHGCAGGLCAHGEVCQYHAAFPAPPATPPGTEGYDLSIHSNPDARAWARFFVETYDRMQFAAPDEDMMLGWFANAMMAAHDHALRAAPPPGETDRDAEFYCGCEHHRPGADARALWDEDGCCQVCGVDVDPWTIRALHAERDRDEARAERDRYRTAWQRAEAAINDVRREATEDRNRLADSRDEARAALSRARAALADLVRLWDRGVLMGAPGFKTTRLRGALDRARALAQETPAGTGETNESNDKENTR